MPGLYDAYAGLGKTLREVGKDIAGHKILPTEEELLLAKAETEKLKGLAGLKSAEADIDIRRKRFEFERQKHLETTPQREHRNLQAEHGKEILKAYDRWRNSPAVLLQLVGENHKSAEQFAESISAAVNVAKNVDKLSGVLNDKVRYDKESMRFMLGGRALTNDEMFNKEPYASAFRALFSSSIDWFESAKARGDNRPGSIIAADGISHYSKMLAAMPPKGSPEALGWSGIRGLVENKKAGLEKKLESLNSMELEKLKMNHEIMKIVYEKGGSGDAGNTLMRTVLLTQIIKSGTPAEKVLEIEKAMSRAASSEELWKVVEKAAPYLDTTIINNPTAFAAYINEFRRAVENPAEAVKFNATRLYTSGPPGSKGFDKVDDELRTSLPPTAYAAVKAMASDMYEEEVRRNRERANALASTGWAATPEGRSAPAGPPPVVETFPTLASEQGITPYSPEVLNVIGREAGRIGGRIGKTMGEGVLKFSSMIDPHRQAAVQHAVNELSRGGGGLNRSAIARELKEIISKADRYGEDSLTPEEREKYEVFRKHYE